VTVARIGILGAGTMGRGIAQVAALGGFQTQVYDPDPEALEVGQLLLGEELAKGVGRGRWSDAEGTAAVERLHGTGAIDELGGCDLLIEAAPEELKLKRRLFAAAAAACGPQTILASNTSSLRIGEIAAPVPEPERVVGMHFFNPPVLMKLVEIVAAERSAEWALEATTEVARTMRRTPIRARDTPGFVANRLARPFSLESLRMLADGVADPPTIDRIVRLGGGFRMGPFELIDLIGLDVNLTIARSFYSQGGKPERWRPSPIQERMVEEGKLGRKNGRGFYEYDEHGNPRSAAPRAGMAPTRNSGEVVTLDRKALAAIDPAAETVLSRLFAQIANETAFALEAGVASPADMDTAVRLGLNWPLGPLGITKLIGAGAAVELLRELEREKGAAYAPAPLLISNINSSG